MSPCPESLLCTEETILSLISSLPSKTASGPDRISSFLLKAAASISLPLSHIFNLSIFSGLFPHEWKTSNIVPIPINVPLLPHPPLTFAPFLFWSLVSKLLEKHIHSILLDFCFNQNLIPPYQFGFLPSRSTTTALLYSSHKILSLLEVHPSVCGVFLDIKKAVNSVTHSPLLKLLQSYDFPPILVNWLHSYLINHSQSVVLNGISSFSKHVSSGVPQGSILGPLFFLLYINGVTNIPLSPNSHMILYADDIFLFKPVDSQYDFMQSFTILPKLSPPGSRQTSSL